MDFRYNTTMRVISAIVLCFFCWTFGGFFDIAYAATNSKQSPDSHWSLVKSQKLNKHKKKKVKGRVYTLDKIGL